MPIAPVAMKPAKISKYKFIYATLYMIENSCKWREISKEYGKWHTVCTEFNRWSKNGTTAKVIAFFL